MLLKEPTFIFYLSEFFNDSRESKNKDHFSAAVVALRMKPCIVIVLDTLFKQAPLPCALDFISRFTDFVRILRRLECKFMLSLVIKFISLQQW